MNPYKKFLSDLKPHVLTKVLHKLYNDDCYYYDFMRSSFNDTLLHCLEYYGIAFIASDGRILLTAVGRDMLMLLFVKEYS